MTRRRIMVGATAIFGAAAARGGAASATAPLRVAAAASFRSALDAIVATYATSHGQGIVVTYGATGSLARQIQQGAPFELLLAADEDAPARLAAAGHTKSAPEILVTGSICLILPKNSPLKLKPDVTALQEAVAEGRIKRLAIANPKLAPCGRAAREALVKAGVLDLVASRFVYGENVGQAAQYVATGAAEAGITACAIVTSEPLAAGLQVIALPVSLHAPINQALAVLRNAGLAADRFVTFLKGGEAQAIFARFGFQPPQRKAS